MKLRAILLFLGLLAFFSASVGGYLYYSSLKRSVLNEVETQAASQAETIKVLLSSYLSSNLNAVRALAGLKEIQQAFVNPNEIALTEANFILDNFNDSLGASVSYMMDQEGKTIASSNRNDRDSFVGKNYSFRPYFQKAISGNPSIYMALGVTSKKRGLYYSYPVYKRTEKTPIGIVILKTSGEATERELLSSLYRAPGMFNLITGPHGVVFMSDHEKFLYRLLWKITDEERIKISKSKQFGKGPWEWAGFERRGEGRVVDKSGDEYLLFQKKIESLPGWNIVHLSNLETISERVSTPFVKIVGYLTLILCAFIGLSVFILYRLAKSDITNRLKAERALRESEEKYRGLVEGLDEAIYRMSLPDGKYEYMSPAAKNVFGYSAEEFLENPLIIRKLIHPDFAEYFKEKWADLIEGKVPPTYKYKILDPEGNERWVVQSNKRIFDDSGNIIAIEGLCRDITKGMQAEEALRESEDKFRSFAEQSLVGIYLISGDVFKYVNPKFADMFGYSVDECLDNMHFPQLVHPEDLATVEKQVGRRLSGETKAVRYSFRGIKKSGETIHVEIYGSSMLLNGKSVATGTMLDITESKRAEALLQSEKENLSTTMENNPNGIVLFDNNGKWIYGNPMLTEMTGYTTEDIQTGKEWFRLAFPDADYRKKVIDAWKKDSKQAGRGEVHEFDVTCKNGQVKQIEFSVTHLADRNVSVLSDVTQRKKIEKSLYEAKLFLDNISDLAYMADNEGNVIYANPAAEKITGLALSEIIDRPLLPLIVEKDHNFLTKVYNRTLAGESLENIVRFNSGITCHFTSLPFKDNHGNIIGTFGIARDISDRLDAENALKESEARLRKAQSVANLGNWEYDISTGKIWGSEQAFRIYGIERTSPYLSLDRVEACIPDATRAGQAWVDLIRENKRYDIELEVRQEVSGQTIVIHSIAELIYENGMPVKVLGVIQDITEQKKAEKERKDLEDQLQQAQKMEAIGTLAGGVAHDLNNILGGLVSYPELLLLQLAEDNPLRKSILTIQKSGEKAAAVVQDLLTLARRGVVVTDVVNLNDIISEYLKSPEYEKLQSYHSGVHLETHLATDTLNILGSSTHLYKAVMNLVSNAAEAMPVGGKIIVTTENRYIDRLIRGYDNVKEGAYVVFTISDTGTGISPEDIEKIFEPFYTKKKMGRSGTGLGMAVVWGTVKDHNGYIDIQSTEGKGTTFTLYFPVTRKGLPEDDSHLAIETYRGNGESLLIVDDVEEQRKIASGMLKELGYSVVSVSSGEEAVEYLKTNKVDLLVLDMIMDPGMDGLDTYKNILELHSGQKAIIASGFSETDRVKQVQSLGAGAYIRKPYTLAKIGIAVKEELEK